MRWARPPGTQIFIYDFSELEAQRQNGWSAYACRHGSDVEVLLRFRADTLDYEYVISGSAAPLYPFIQQVHSIFGSNSFSPKDLYVEAGVSRSTAHRYIDRLHRAEVLRKRGHGNYVLTATALALKGKELTWPPAPAEGF